MPDKGTRSILLEVVVRIEGVLCHFYAGIRSYFDHAWGKDNSERFFQESKERSETPHIWIHAASVGEVKGISPLIYRILEQAPEVSLVITTTSFTGRDTARKLFPESTVRLLPLESSTWFTRFITHFKPSLVIINETEIWPVMIHVLSKASVPMLLVNARISDRAYPRYRFFRFFFSILLKRLDRIYAQSELDKERFISLGASPSEIESIGSTKYDVPQVSVEDVPFVAWWSGFDRYSDHLVWTAGSVREAEEDQIVSAFLELKKDFDTLILIIAPRHPDRFEALSQKLAEQKLPFIRRSQHVHFPNELSGAHIIVLDTLGELAGAYYVSDFSFVGGTLCPVGGHNVLEPAQFGKPVVIGPHLMNVRAVVQSLKDNDALLMVSDKSGLIEVAGKILSDPGFAQSMGERSKRTFDALQGTSDKIMNAIKKYL
jgi:3-deoxy-D-manno-octulosonic-acid transferase